MPDDQYPLQLVRPVEEPKEGAIQEYEQASSVACAFFGGVACLYAQWTNALGPSSGYGAVLMALDDWENLRLTIPAASNTIESSWEAFPYPYDFRIDTSEGPDEYARSRQPALGADPLGVYGELELVDFQEGGNGIRFFRRYIIREGVREVEEQILGGPTVEIRLVDVSYFWSTFGQLWGEFNIEAPRLADPELTHEGFWVTSLRDHTTGLPVKATWDDRGKYTGPKKFISLEPWSYATFIQYCLYNLPGQLNVSRASRVALATVLPPTVSHGDLAYDKMVARLDDLQLLFAKQLDNTVHLYTRYQGSTDEIEALKPSMTVTNRVRGPNYIPQVVEVVGGRVMREVHISCEPAGLDRKGRIVPLRVALFDWLQFVIPASIRSVSVERNAAGLSMISKKTFFDDCCRWVTQTYRGQTDYRFKEAPGFSIPHAIIDEIMSWMLKLYMPKPGHRGFLPLEPNRIKTNADGSKKPNVLFATGFANSRVALAVKRTPVGGRTLRIPGLLVEDGLSGSEVVKLTQVLFQEQMKANPRKPPFVPFFRKTPDNVVRVIFRDPQTVEDIEASEALTLQDRLPTRTSGRPDQQKDLSTIELITFFLSGKQELITQVAQDLKRNAPIQRRPTGWALAAARDLHQFIVIEEIDPGAKGVGGSVQRFTVNSRGEELSEQLATPIGSVQIPNPAGSEEEEFIFAFDVTATPPPEYRSFFEEGKELGDLVFLEDPSGRIWKLPLATWTNGSLVLEEVEVLDDWIPFDPIISTEHAATLAEADRAAGDIPPGRTFEEHVIALSGINPYEDRSSVQAFREEARIAKKAAADQKNRHKKKKWGGVDGREVSSSYPSINKRENREEIWTESWHNHDSLKVNEDDYKIDLKTGVVTFKEIRGNLLNEGIIDLSQGIVRPAAVSYVAGYKETPFREVGDTDNEAKFFRFVAQVVDPETGAWLELPAKESAIRGVGQFRKTIVDRTLVPKIDIDGGTNVGDLRYQATRLVNKAISIVPPGDKLSKIRSLTFEYVNLKGFISQVQWTLSVEKNLPFARTLINATLHTKIIGTYPWKAFRTPRQGFQSPDDQHFVGKGPGSERQ